MAERNVPFPKISQPQSVRFVDQPATAYSFNATASHNQSFPKNYQSWLISLAYQLATVHTPQLLNSQAQWLLHIS